MYSVASFPLLFLGLLASLSCLLRLRGYCLQDGLDASTLHSASLALVYSLLELGFVDPSPQDLGVVLVHSPSSDRSFIGRSTMV